MMLVTRVGVGQRRQITLPAEVCERLGVRAGDELDLMLDGESIVLRRETTTTQRALVVLKRAFGAPGAHEDAVQTPLRVTRSRSLAKKRRR
jgi:AbrB family looped-hinge helix DNA binding protein